MNGEGKGQIAVAGYFFFSVCVHPVVTPRTRDKVALYDEILDISSFFALILTSSCCIFSTANTGDEVIFLHYFDFVSCYKKV